MNKLPRPKKCKVCREHFVHFSTLAKVCSPECAIAFARSNKSKEYKRETRRRREQAKSRGDWTREAQTSFNKFIRERDIDLPCISCNRHHSGQYHAGHYRTVGSHPELRFCEINCHKQCAPCNNHKSGNIVEYRNSLIYRINDIELDWLEGPHEPAKYTIDDIKAIKKLYADKYKALIVDKL